MRKKLEHPEWFFMWSTGEPYITCICQWTRRDAIREVESMLAQPWRKTYREGGRIVRCSIQVRK